VLEGIQTQITSSTNLSKDQVKNIHPIGILESPLASAASISSCFSINSFSFWVALSTTKQLVNPFHRKQNKNENLPAYFYYTAVFRQASVLVTPYSVKTSNYVYWPKNMDLQFARLTSYFTCKEWSELHMVLSLFEEDIDQNPCSSSLQETNGKNYNWLNCLVFVIY